MGVQGRVTRLTRYARKGAAGETVENARLLEGSGMEGDFHARGGDTQISLLSAETKRLMNAGTEGGLCVRRYKENILFDGLPDSVFVPGARLLIGEAELEIGARGKRCFEECPLFSRKQSCALAGRNLFAKVRKGGMVQVDDSIVVL